LLSAGPLYKCMKVKELHTLTTKKSILHGSHYQLTISVSPNITSQETQILFFFGKHLYHWRAGLDTCFITSCGLTQIITSGSIGINTPSHSVAWLGFKQKLKRSSYWQRAPAITGIQAQVLRVETQWINAWLMMIAQWAQLVGLGERLHEQADSANIYLVKSSQTITQIQTKDNQLDSNQSNTRIESVKRGSVIISR